MARGFSTGFENSLISSERLRPMPTALLQVFLMQRIVNRVAPFVALQLRLLSCVGVCVVLLFVVAQGGNGGEILDLEEDDVPAAAGAAPAASGVSSALRLQLSRTLVCWGYSFHYLMCTYSSWIRPPVRIVHFPSFVSANCLRCFAGAFNPATAGATRSESQIFQTAGRDTRSHAGSQRRVCSTTRCKAPSKCGKSTKLCSQAARIAKPAPWQVSEPSAES